ncbi:hypothetical protein ACFQ88_02870 [Paenibacillus sp. NPDC056579]|uniref:hypothetical protein n=1 Tax=Paenibacillus sp. NPDC056579 TaxID=3345871 RepID=UPI0036CB08D8
MAAVINTGPLPEERARIVEKLVQEWIALHPGMDGFILTGSIWNPDTQLPHSDIDINWHGSANERIHDPRLDTHSIFQAAGITVEMAHYFWGHLSEPESMRLPVIVSLNRAHILWEREGRFSIPQQRTYELLSDAQWVESAVERLISEMKARAELWLDPEYCRENKDDHQGFDFVRSVVGPTVGLLDSVDLRPPSAARKGLMEITQTSALCGMPEISEMVLTCLGADLMREEEIREWNRLLEELYTSAADLCPGVQLVKREYHVQGIQSMVSMGYSRECVWPLWRGFADCMQLLEGVSDKGEEAFVRFAERLQAYTIEDITKKAKQNIAIIELIQGNRQRLSEHLLSVVRSSK